MEFPCCKTQWGQQSAVDTWIEKKENHCGQSLKEWMPVRKSCTESNLEMFRGTASGIEHDTYCHMHLRDPSIWQRSSWGFAVLGLGAHPGLTGVLFPPARLPHHTSCRMLIRDHRQPHHNPRNLISTSLTIQGPNYKILMSGPERSMHDPSNLTFIPAKYRTNKQTNKEYWKSIVRLWLIWQIPKRIA